MHRIFTDIRLFQIFILGIFSAMPLKILYGTLFAWLKEAGLGIEVITTFSIARIFYSLKFIWAPIVDHMKIPVLHRVGRRKSWMILCAALLGVIIFMYSRIDPSESIANIYWLTIALGAVSATFDIAFDAFRIEKLEKDLQAIGAANAITGYRIGLLIAGAGAFYIADLYGWSEAYLMLCGLFVLAVIFILCISEEDIPKEGITGLNVESFKIMVFDPFIEFFQKRYSIAILLAVIFYKLGDAMLGVVAYPFYLELGFTKTEISKVSMIYGMCATIVGTYIAGWLMLKKGDLKSLIIAGFLQSVTNLSFVWLNHQGHDITALYIAITIENVANGMGMGALVGYLSNLCNKRYSATQYALLSSASGLFSHTIVVWGGAIQQSIGWDMYFIMTIVMAIPGIAILCWLNKAIPSETSKETGKY